MNRYLYSVGFIFLTGALISVACMPMPTDQPAPVEEAPAAQVEETEVVVVVTEVVEGEPELPETEVVGDTVQPEEEITRVVVLEVEAEQPETVLWFQVLRGTGFVNGEAVSDGEIASEDSFATGPNGFAEMGLIDDGRVLFEIKPNTVLVPKEITTGTIRLFLEIGTIRTSLEDEAGLRVVIAADAGESEAGGTTWISEADETGALLVAVLEGRVLVRTPDDLYKVAVNPGESTYIPQEGDPIKSEYKAIVYLYSSQDTIVTGSDPQRLTLTGGYSSMADKLFEQDYFIEDSIFPVPEDFYDVLITVGSLDDLTEEYINSIQDWVESGKGLFVIGEGGVDYGIEGINHLLEPFGIWIKDMQPRNGPIPEYPGFTVNHPINDNVNYLPLDVYCRLDLDTEYAVALMGDPLTELVVLAASKNDGNGRVLVLCDTVPLSNIGFGDDPESMETFILNAVQWLAALD